MGNTSGGKSDGKANKNSHEDNEDIRLHEITNPFEKQVFEGTMFYVKGNKNVGLRQYCILCNEERFTHEEIQILSNENLVPEEFNKLDFGYACPVVCNKCKHRNEDAIKILIDKDYIKYNEQIGNYGCYNFGVIWVTEFKIMNFSISNKYR